MCLERDRPSPRLGVGELRQLPTPHPTSPGSSHTGPGTRRACSLLGSWHSACPLLRVLLPEGVTFPHFTPLPAQHHLREAPILLPHTWLAGTLPSALSLPELDLLAALLVSAQRMTAPHTRRDFEICSLSDSQHLEQSLANTEHHEESAG